MPLLGVSHKLSKNLGLTVLFSRHDVLQLVVGEVDFDQVMVPVLVDTEETGFAEVVEVALAAKAGQVLVGYGFPFSCFEVDDVDRFLLSVQVDYQMVIGHAKGGRDTLCGKPREESPSIIVVVDDLIVATHKSCKDNCVIIGGDCFEYFQQPSVELIDNFVLE